MRLALSIYLAGCVTASAATYTLPSVVVSPASGVTLKAIDGGPTYYGDNGLTYAHNAGWDSPGFFPIGAWAAPIQTSADAARWAALGWNTAWVPSRATQSVIQAAGISLVISVQSGWTIWTGYGFTPGAETVGIETFDEPQTSAQFYNGMAATANSLQDGRFWWVNNTQNWTTYGQPATQGTQGAWLAALQTTPSGLKRHIDIASLDTYPVSRNDQYGPPLLKAAWGLPSNPTPDQYRRGFWYGDVIDQQRAYQLTPAPLMGIVENGGPFTSNTTGASYIQPAELNWAVWESIIHGARGIVYFNNTFGGPGLSNDDMNTAYFQSPQSGAAVSMYAQTAATDALVKSLAPVINSPFAVGYATVVPASGEKVPLTSAGIAALAGIDLSTHWYQGGAYIFTATRLSGSATNIPATFTIIDKSRSSVTVVNESRTIPVANGGFSDVFATGATVHIYKVN
jgi:hypothetical protein